MFGWFKGRGREDRAAQVDVGAIYAAFWAGGGASYSWQVSPAVLSGSVGFHDNAGALIDYSRRLARQSGLLRSYRRCMVGGILTGEPEAPNFSEAVTEELAATVADLWRAAHPVDVEVDLLRRLIVEGDVLLMPDGEVIPADGFEAVTTGPDWNKRVVGWKIGKGSRTHRKGTWYIGDVEPGQTRGEPWIAGALPYAAALVNIRVGAGHALGTAARWTTLMTADPTRQAAALDPGVRRGVQGDGETAEGQREDLKTTGVGSVVFLRAGEKTERPAAGPDKEAQNYESILEAEAATALNLPLSELKSDYSSGTYSNLRMAWQDAVREYERRRVWFHRAYRLPLYLDALTGWLADGQLRAEPKVMAALKLPKWAGPYREPPQPEKELMAAAALARAGLTEEAEKQLNQGGGNGA